MGGRPFLATLPASTVRTSLLNNDTVVVLVQTSTGGRKKKKLTYQSVDRAHDGSRLLGEEFS